MSRKLDDELQEQIRYLKKNYPRMSADAIFRQLGDNSSITHGQVSESTICRFVNQLQLEMKQTINRDMRRYERPHINEIWCGDSSVGPRLTDASGKKRRVYIVALLDDDSGMSEMLKLVSNIVINGVSFNLLNNIRQTRDSPPPSFRFHLTMDTLGLGYILPTTGSDSELSSVSDVRRQAHLKRQSSRT